MTDKVHSSVSIIGGYTWGSDMTAEISNAISLADFVGTTRSKGRSACTVAILMYDTRMQKATLSTRRLGHPCPI